MNNFIFENKTKVYFGKGGVKEYLGCLLGNYGETVMLAYGGGSIKRNGVYDEIMGILNAAGKRIVEFSGIMSNPTYAKVQEGAKLARENHVDLILAVGGGSVLDVGKSLCCLYGREFANVDMLRETITAGNLIPTARWVGVPTTAGTGSEVTCWATVWDPTQDKKRSLECQANYAYAALVDSELTQNMPVKLAISSALDACAHAVESYWANHTNAVSRGLALEAISTVMGNIEGLLDNKPAAHEAMARGSLLAGMAFSNTKTTACHSISYPLTMHYGIPHGVAVALLLGPVLELNAPATPDLNRLLAALNVEDGKSLRNHVTELFEKSGLPATLQGWGVPADKLSHLAALGMTKGRADNNPVALDKTTIENILHSIYD